MTPSHSLAAKEHEKLPPFGIDRNFVLVPPSTADVDKYQFSTYHYHGLSFMSIQLHQESDLNPVVLSDIGGIFTFAHSSGD